MKQETVLICGRKNIAVICVLGVTNKDETTDTDTTTGMRSEKCVVRRFRRCANVIESAYTNVDSIVYYTLRLYGIAYCS